MPSESSTRKTAKGNQVCDQYHGCIPEDLPQEVRRVRLGSEAEAVTVSNTNTTSRIKHTQDDITNSESDCNDAPSTPSRRAPAKELTFAKSNTLESLEGQKPFVSQGSRATIMGKRMLTMGSTFLQARHQKTCMRVSRLRRASAIAVDFHLRAMMSAEDTKHTLRGSATCAFPEADAQNIVVFRRWLLGSPLARLMKMFSMFSLLLGSALLSFEPTCERSSERDTMKAMKSVHLATSIVYLVVAVAQLRAMGWTPSRVLNSSVLCARGRLLTTELDEDFLGNVIEQDKVDGTCLIFLDALISVAIVAEILHLSEEPTDWPTPSQWLWLVNLVKVWRFVSSPRSDVRPPHEGFVNKVSQLVAFLFILVHMCACIFGVAALFNAKQGYATWADVEGSLLTEVRSCKKLYVAAFYFAAYTVTSVGHGDIVPANDLERQLDAVLMVISQMFAAMIFAEFNFIITTHRYWRAQRHHRHTQTETALASMGVPDAMCMRVMAYQDYVWEVQKERRAKESLSDLSDCLKEELRTIVYHRLVINAPFLHKLSTPALRRIIHSLSDEVHLPSDFIVARGSEGSSLYFLRDGTCGIFLTEAAPHWNEVEVKVVERGDYFGEVALLTRQKRSSWVMARMYCVTSELHKSTIEDVISADPSCVVKLAKSMQKALHLEANPNRWSDVKMRLERNGLDLEDIWFSFCAQLEEDLFDDELKVMSWASFHSLMKDIGVGDFEQKLIWIDLDADEAGWVSFQRFVQVAYNGTRDTEAEQLERSLESLRAISRSTGTAGQAAEVIGRSTVLGGVRGARGQAASMGSIDSSSSAGGQRPLAETKSSDSVSDIVHKELAYFSSNIDAKLDIIKMQVSALTRALASTSATRPDGSIVLEDADDLVRRVSSLDEEEVQSDCS